MIKLGIQFQSGFIPDSGTDNESDWNCELHHEFSNKFTDNSKYAIENVHSTKFGWLNCK